MNQFLQQDLNEYISDTACIESDQILNDIAYINSSHIDSIIKHYKTVFDNIQEYNLFIDCLMEKIKEKTITHEQSRIMNYIDILINSKY